MSDLRPTGTPVVIGGQERNLLFTIGLIESIQEECNSPLVELMGSIARVANFETKPEDMKKFHKTVAAFLTADTGKKVHPEDLDGTIKPAEMQKIAVKLLEAYGFSMPDPDDDEEDEEEDPNQETGL